MQEFLADLHIHSRFSRATSRKLDIPLLAAYACVKGLGVLGTGDFTHPQWREELARHLRFDEASGLYALADASPLSSILPELPETLFSGAGPGQAARPGNKAARTSPVRFMLQGEISSIYKRGGKVRKVHNLVYMPTLEAAEAFSRKLETIGNLHSDGRPILGLDSRDLLEMVLEAHPLAFLVPAHIWTPWFSIFGSKSGFDRLEDCFGDLSGEVFALETGLSSDPAMNRLWSALDGFRLISNSDAHSGENLGREANVFSGEVSYQGMLRALKEPERSGPTRFCGTVEFFPEEGKYHMDGHRKCGVLFTPEQTRAHKGLCPVCGGQLTVGVFNRVMELADRSEPSYRAGDAACPDNGLAARGFVSMVPLAEVLGEILGVGPKSRRVADMYARVLERFGPELDVLRHVPEEELGSFLPPLGEAVRRMRRGEVRLQGGYDGEYGVVRMFSDRERAEITRGAGLIVRKGKGSARGAQGLSLPGTEAKPENTAPSLTVHRSGGKKRRTASLPSEDAQEDGDDFVFSSLEEPATPLPARPVENSAPAPETGREAAPGAEETPEAPETPGAQSDSLNPDQERAVSAGPGPVLVLAGPGTGKTRTLIARIMHLLHEGIGARRILAVTFTRRAASEMDSRLRAALGEDAPLPRTDTLHALALELWHKTHADVPLLLSEENARRVFAEANADIASPVLREAWQSINLARERLEPPPSEFAPLEQRYIAQKNGWNLADYTDLLEFWMEQIAGGLYSCPWGHVLVDEIQDLSPLQLHLVRALLSSSGEGFFGIGDPDQSIYSFRGAHGQCLEFFKESWPSLELVRLDRNYRSRPAILALAHAALGSPDSGALEAARPLFSEAALFEAPSAEAEAAWVADRVAALLGAGSHTLADAKAVAGQSGDSPAGPGADEHSPGDIAVLVRTHALAGIYRKALSSRGVPVSEPAGDAFWADERAGIIIRAAERMLGIAVASDEEGPVTPPCPDKVLAKGPLGVAAYLSDFPPFDALFWQSRAFRSLVKAYDANQGWSGLITWINLQTELELARAKGEKVQVLSLHAAKGLEFSSVFLPALEDGLLPFSGPELLTGKLPDNKSAGNIEEERRLFYVGVTRAKDYLFLSRAAKRTLYGRELRLKPSRFLEPLPEAHIRRSTLVARTTRKEEQLTLL